MDFILKSFKEELSVRSLANVHYFELSRSLHTKADSHSFCELVYVEKGKIDIVSDNYCGILQAGHFILHGKGERHSLSCSSGPANIIIVGFECDSPKLQLLTHTPIELDDEPQKMLAEIIKEGVSVYLPPYDIPNVRDMKKRGSYDFGADQLIKNYLEIFLIKCIRAEEAKKQNPQYTADNNKAPELKEIDGVKKYLERNFCRKIKIDDLCFLFNTNKTTLSNSFKSAFGHTIVEHLNDLRIEYTKELIDTGEHTLTDIAEILNMSSVHYLTSLFKKQTGQTPTEYLKQRNNR